MWYTKFKYEPMIEFGNMLNYTAMGLGNHDFDDSILGIAARDSAATGGNGELRFGEVTFS